MEKRSVFRIQIISSQDLEIEYLEGDQFVIGRSKKAQISLDENGISRQHLSAVYDNGALWLQDNHSSNGTYVNGKKITPGEPYLYKEGQTIRLGPSPKTLRIKRIEESEESQFKAIRARDYATTTIRKIDRISSHIKEKAFTNLKMRKEEGRELFQKTKKKAQKRASEILAQGEAKKLEILKEIETKEDESEDLSRKIASRKNQLEGLEKEHQEALSDYKKTEDHIEALQNQVKDLETQKKDRDDAEKQLQVARKKKEFINKDLKELENEKRTLTEKNIELNDELNELQSKKESLLEENKQFEESLNHSKSAYEKIQDEIESGQSRSSELESQIHEKENDLESKRIQEKEIDSEINGLQERREHLKLETKSLSDQVISLKEQENDLGEQIKASQEEKTKLIESIEELKQERSSLSQEISESQKEAEQQAKKLRDQLEADEVEFKLKKTKLENQHEEILHKKLKSDKELYQTKLKLQELETSLSTLQKEKDELAQANEDSSKSLENKKNDLQEIESRLKSLNSEIEKLSQEKANQKEKLQKEKNKALKETELAISEKRVLEMEKLKEQENNFWKAFRLDVAEKSELLTYHLQDKIQKSKEPPSQSEIEKLIRSVVLEEAGLDKEAEKKDFITAKKEKAYWRRFALKSTGVAAALVILAFSPYYVEWISKKAQQYALSKESAAENFVKDIKEKRRLASTFTPEKTKEFKDSYTDNLLFTKNYLEIKERDSVQQAWVLRLRDLILEEFELRESQLMLALEVEANLIHELKRLRDRIRPAEKEEGISRLRKAEKDYISQMESLLGGPRELQRFLDVEKEFIKSRL
jgi:pSer/pThr/pTyr-binding forkhead associated (FHA) protein